MGTYPGQRDVGRPVVAETLHQIFVAANHSDKGSPPPITFCHARSFARVGLDAEILLRSTGSDAEADENLVDDQDDVLLSADLPQAPEPIGISGLVEMRAARTVDQRQIRSSTGPFG